jgi:hypothetical protein
MTPTMPKTDPFPVCVDTFLLKKIATGKGIKSIVDVLKGQREDVLIATGLILRSLLRKDNSQTS